MATTDKITAMSRALGAVYLSHKVDELERTAGGIANGHNSHGSRRGWGRGGGSLGRGRGRGGHASARGGMPPNTNSTSISTRPPPTTDLYSPLNPKPISCVPKPQDNPVADRIVVDASVLIHALKEVKRWCKEDRKERVIIPLEALNTLDLLKKGNSVSAMRARAASRFLEDQVGTNPRIDLQRDNAFVPWQSIEDNLGPSTPSDQDSDSDTSSQPAPEWLRQTLCSAKWEVDRGGKVVLAITGSFPVDRRVSPSGNGPVTYDNDNGKWEIRAKGDLVRKWADKAGLEILSVHVSASDSDISTSPTTPIPLRGCGRGGGGRPSRGSRGRRDSHSHGERDSGLVERVSTSPIKVLRVLARGEKLDP